MQYIIGLFSIAIVGIVCVLIAHYKFGLFDKDTYNLNTKTNKNKNKRNY